MYFGALFNPAQLKSNDPCVSGTGSLQNAGPPSQTSGAAAVTQLLTGTLSG